MKIKLQQALINFFFYVLPGIIVIWRHIDISFKKTTSLLPLIGIVAVILIIYFIKSKNKTRIMRAKELKEIQDNERKPGTIIYFYKKFVVIYIIIFMGLYYVQFNFRSLTGTMELIAISLLIGAIIRVNLASNTGH